jgi:hypothetical protein
LTLRGILLARERRKATTARACRSVQSRLFAEIVLSL